MDKEKSQVETTIKFIFCKPFNEYYYSYAINTTDKTHIKSKDDIKTMLININPKLSRKISQAIDQFETFIYNVDDQIIMPLDSLEDTEITDQQNDTIRNEESQDRFLTKTKKFDTFYSKNFMKKGF